jgi:aspartate/tyrosine/aromatic aminotransferase
MFDSLTPAPPDPILGLTEAWRDDPNPKKVNLGVGVFKDDRGETPVLETVKAAAAAILAAETSKNYLPIAGDPAYRKRVQTFVFEGPAATAAERAVTIQALGGTGALRVGAEFVRFARPEGRAWLSTPTWANHRGVFAATGMDIRQYPWYDAPTRELDADAMLASLREVPAGDTVVLHACCHNPSGVDPEPGQWAAIAAAAAERGWLPFLDTAYLGFGRGLAEDRTATEAFAAAGVPFLQATSFSKNLALYGERVGALTFVGPEAGVAATVLSHLQRIVRVLYSNPPMHGAAIAARILGDRLLRTRWEEELGAMRDRIHAVRGELVDRLAARGVAQDFSFIRKQQGMFSFSGLSDDAVARLRAEKAIYIVKGGRINVAGLTSANLDYVCDSIAEVLRAGQ